MELIIVTGLSGAGKTQAIRVLEDLSYFCVDNLPPALVPPFLELVSPVLPQVGPPGNSNQDTVWRIDRDICGQLAPVRQLEGAGQPEPLERRPQRLALVMDVRGGRFFTQVFQALEYLEGRGLAYEILFLEASDETLVRRYKETRRRHPLSREGQVLEGILQEREKLQELRGRASKVIDTSDLSPQRLRELIVELFGQERDQRLLISVVSFGYKYGLPLDADLVLDVRFLPNPHYVENLRPLTGCEAPVRDYVLASPVSLNFVARVTELLGFLLPYYVQEGKSHLVIALGCTGGQHRSVVLTEEVAGFLRRQTCRVTVHHRDLERGRRAGP